MKGSELMEWRLRSGLTKAGLSKILGCGRNSVSGWEASPDVPRYIALAIAAYSYGLKPMGTDNA